jgi:hypothetical protein
MTFRSTQCLLKHVMVVSTVDVWLKFTQAIIVIRVSKYHIWSVATFILTRVNTHEQMGNAKLIKAIRCEGGPKGAQWTYP